MTYSQKGNQKAFYECTGALDIDSTKIDVRSNKLYFQFNVEDSPKNLKDFVWLKDKPKEYFTGYLVNTSDSTFSANIQDGSLIIIQEALDKDGNWNPIEYWVYSGCGNSYFSLKLDTGKYVMIPIKKYSGKFKTKIRLKFKYGADVLYSESFEGSLNVSQFEKETEDVNGILYHGPANYLNKE
ncbi:MAG: hypothetical protein DBW72_05940 [Flavobacteriales bacterium]|nr:MAG: hypothetical protein DBW72_05940 [Flavobacteriales bacterium]